MDVPFSAVVQHGGARALIGSLAETCSTFRGVGSLSSCVYDSAWVSMVKQKQQDQKRWRFPECFQYVLDRQNAEGGWISQANASDADEILTALAAMLALQRHTKEPLGLSVPCDIESRLAKAQQYLLRRLESWNIDNTDQVGFEILIPAHLKMLEKEDISLTFSQLPSLMALGERKLQKIRPEYLYAKTPTTLLHSLEAFVGLIDFDKVSHHKTSGSMMASPSSTAAYLMNRSTWDHEAEEYLEAVVQLGTGKGNGGVPSAFPTTIFELTWVVSTLLTSGFSYNDLGRENLDRIGDYLQSSLANQGGVVGFVPDVAADADDTAKAILCLNLLGRPSLPNQLVAQFEAEHHFKTYALERNPSFSANCNVLEALLHAPNPGDYTAQIAKAARFLCDIWYEGSLKDKWNLSPQYPMMLLTQTFVRLLRLVANQTISGLPNDLIQSQIPIVLLQALVRTLQTQDQQGSWSQSREITAYAILTLAALAPLPHAQALHWKVVSAIASGRHFLSQCSGDWDKPEHLWIEKVTYGSATLCQTYCLGAMRATIEPWSSHDSVFPLKQLKSIEKFVQFFSRLPLFKDEPEWRVRASLVEGYLFLPELAAAATDILPRVEKSDDKYLEYIPFTWTLVNNMQNSPFGAGFLRDMMMVSMLIYQSDEYMEGIIGTHFKNNLEPVKRIIRRLCQPSPDMCEAIYTEVNHDSPPHSPGILTPEASSPEEGGTTKEAPFALAVIEQTLSRFVSFMLDHAKVKQASLHDQAVVRRKLQDFLLAHCTQIEDNTRLAQQHQQCQQQLRSPQEQETSTEQALPTLSTSFSGTAGRSYHEWVHATSAVHTSAPFSFYLVACMAQPSHNGRDFFATAQQKYIAEALSHNLAAMCRQYNDVGSMARDRNEGNLNSVDWPEFHHYHHHHNNCGLVSGPGRVEATPPSSPGADDAKAKAELFQIAEFERGCLDLAVAQLDKMASRRVMETVRVFVQVTDFYGQIYIARDLSNRMR